MTDASSTPTTPPLTGQDINLAASATRRLLVANLVPLGITFEQSIVINQVGSGRVASETALAALLRKGLQLSDAEIESLLATMADADLVGRGDGGALTLTVHGHRTFERSAAVVAGLVAELYAGFASGELARTREILAEITARAEARLAAA